MRDRLIKLVNKAKEEYANDVTNHTETEYIVECLLNHGVVFAIPTDKHNVTDKFVGSKEKLDFGTLTYGKEDREGH